MIEHGAFLSSLLYGMNLLPATDQVVTDKPTFGSLSRPPEVLLRDPYSATADDPFIYAVVANHPVDLQVETVLSSLAHLLGRQKLLLDIAEQGIAQLDRQAAEADQQAQQAVQDVMRTRGWPAAAADLRARSIAAKRPLIVHYDPVAFDYPALQRRAPVLRHVYNAMPEARVVVDKLAVLMSQTLTTIGGGTVDSGAFVRQLLDVGEQRTYLAHLARDAFVCGNGYLSFGVTPDEDLQLLPPESTRLIAPNTAVVLAEGQEVLHEHVLHVRGAYQIGSSYGLSVLEPFVFLLVERQGYEATLAFEAEAEAEAVRAGIAREELARLKGTADLARRSLPRLEKRAQDLLGGPATLTVEVPDGLYFPGYEDMAPAAEGLTLMPAGDR